MAVTVVETAPNLSEVARDYQAKAIESIRSEFLQGRKKVLLWLATGAGKTFIFSKMIKDASARGKKCIVVVRGRKLVDQASKRLFRESVYHGVLMASHWNYRPQAPVQVCSIDTLIARELRPEADLIVVDEAHMANSKGYKEFLSKYNTFVVAVTATPYVDGGLKHVADSIVHPITMTELTSRGYLVPFRYFAPNDPDLRSVEISKATKDYVVDQLAGVMETKALTGEIVKHWQEIAHGRPTICFAVNVHHSKILVERFKEAGITAEHCDADSSDYEREEVIRNVERGDTKVICNVGIFCTGVDIPCISAIVMARPTKSKNLFIQQAGRGTRTLPGKENCILLDHAGNILRHGLPTDEFKVNLDGKITERSEKKTKICKVCFAAFRGTTCPECGVEPPEILPEPPEETSDRLQELTNVENPIARKFRELKAEALASGKKTAWACHRLVNTFGYEETKLHLPFWFRQQHENKDAFNPFSGSPFQPAIPQK